MGNTASGHAKVKSQQGTLLVQFSGNLSPNDAESFVNDLKNVARLYGLEVIVASVARIRRRATKK